MEFIEKRIEEMPRLPFYTPEFEEQKTEERQEVESFVYPQRLTEDPGTNELGKQFLKAFQSNKDSQHAGPSIQTEDLPDESPEPEKQLRQYQQDYRIEENDSEKSAGEDTPQNQLPDYDEISIAPPKELKMIQLQPSKTA